VNAGRRRESDRLDELLEGRREPPVEGRAGEGAGLDGLVEAAKALRAGSASLRLDDAVAREHLARALRGDAPPRLVAVAERPEPWTWRRRAVTMALVAALVAAPAAVASARSLPGDPLYVVKRTVERLRLGTTRSPEDAAAVRVRLARERLRELRALVLAGRLDELAAAGDRARAAVAAAAAAIAQARSAGAGDARLGALDGELRAIARDTDSLLAQARRAGAAPTPGDVPVVRGDPRAGTGAAPSTGPAAGQGDHGGGRKGAKARKGDRSGHPRGEGAADAPPGGGRSHPEGRAHPEGKGHARGGEEAARDGDHGRRGAHADR